MGPSLMSSVCNIHKHFDVSLATKHSLPVFLYLSRSLIYCPFKPSVFVTVSIICETFMGIQTDRKGRFMIYYTMC